MTIVIFRNVCTMAAIIAAYGVYTSPKETQVSNLTLANVEALARYELPEVTITCDDSEPGGGQCWSGDCEPVHTPFGPFLEWDCYFFSGYMSDYCVDGVPC